MRNLTPDDDFAFDTAEGLPGPLPEGERILWQGRPKALPLARQSMWLDWVVGYFLLLIVWRVSVSSLDTSLAQALGHAAPLAVIGVGAVLLIVGAAWLMARGAIYTLTTHRVAMRIGAALQITLNLPYTRITGAQLNVKGGVGTIALSLDGDSKVSYLVAWPHVRPWRMAKPEPALRCIPEPERVARILAQAVETRVSDATSIQVEAPAAAPAVAAE
ncbi:MAG: photosynthetic complex putative assembly protein PuhB [Shimia sp.]